VKCVAAMSYHIGEVVLMEWHGWLKAFRVVAAHTVSETEVEYRLAMLEVERPAHRFDLDSREGNQD
jgi:hypothetical protein